MRAYWDRLQRLPSLVAVRREALKLPRETLLQMLQWNDGNASWLDDLADREQIPHATKREAVRAIVETINDSVWAWNDSRRKT